jgi:SAM-dependent methyltransferase
VASLHILTGRALAWLYTKAWGRSGLHWFDHRIDFLRGPHFWYWQERGILGSQMIRSGDHVLDLCCGEGFYDLMYFSDRAKQIDALDMDSRAIKSAMAKNDRGNVHFYICDVVRDDFPSAKYDTVLCFSALQQLTEGQLHDLLPKIRGAMNPGGLFFGSVSVIPENKVLVDEEGIRSCLGFYFQSVELHSSPWPNGRIEWYFDCRNPLAAEIGQ